MNTIAYKIILFCAFIIAGILVFLGISRSKVKYKGLFGILLTLFVGSAMTQGLWAKPSAPDFMQEFKGRARWKKIKAFWRKLDAIKPNEQGYYMSSLDWKEIDRLKKEAAEIFGYEAVVLKDKSPDLNLSLYEKVLYSLIIDRIENFGIPVHMMSRMMPPPTLAYRYSMVNQMEREIDVLIRLSKNHKISSKEFQNSWDRISYNITSYAIMNTVALTWGVYNYMNIPMEQTMSSNGAVPFNTVIDTWQEGILSSYKKSQKYYGEELKKQKDMKKISELKEYQDRLNVNYQKVKQDLDELKGKEQYFINMIEALEK